MGITIVLTFDVFRRFTPQPLSIHIIQNSNTNHHFELSLTQTSNSMPLSLSLSAKLSLTDLSAYHASSSDLSIVAFQRHTADLLPDSDPAASKILSLA